MTKKRSTPAHPARPKPGKTGQCLPITMTTASARRQSRAGFRFVRMDPSVQRWDLPHLCLSKKIRGRKLSPIAAGDA